MTKKIGVLGGTFDPIHFGHINLAKIAFDELQLDKVIIVPANYPWLKKPSKLTQTKHRIRMIRIFIESSPWLELSKIDIFRGGKTYTKDTLEELKITLGQKAKLFLILGSDSINELSKWREYKKIFDLSQIVVGERPKFEINRNNHKNIVVLDFKMLNISSSLIRKNIRKGLSTKGLIPSKIRRYIDKHRLYIED